jgi:hypothetical protein
MKKIELFKQTKKEKKEFKDLAKDSLKVAGGLALLGVGLHVAKELLIDD